jgi:hypothetical protein
MDRSNQLLGILDAEGIDSREVLALESSCEGEIMLRESRLALLEILIEHLIARAPRGAIDELM